MTRLRKVANYRELKRRELLLLRDKFAFLDPQLLDFRVQCRAGTPEFRCSYYFSAGSRGTLDDAFQTDPS
jgi:hypothetical protein